jgi:hypothetical protein
MPETHNPVVIDAIAHNVYQTLVDIQQHKRFFLTEKYRNFAWCDRESNFLTWLIPELTNTADRDALILKFIKIIQGFFIPSFLLSPEFCNLIVKIRQIIYPETELKPKDSTNDAIAVLLLDIENLQLDIETEKFLATVCTNPIQVKIAFANWRHLGKLDAELHERGYDLIHVPAGRDNADGKMIAVGLSVREHYPKVREVLVCSSDTVMTNLCNHLQKYGLTVYRVSRMGDHITVSNYQTGKNKTYSTQKPQNIPPLAQCITNLQSIITFEQERTASQWVKLSRISSLYQEKYAIKLSQIVAAHLPGKRARDIFLDTTSVFVVHTPPGHSELYVTLFAATQIKQEIITDAILQTEVKTQSIALSKIDSKADLEQALVNIIQALTSKAPGSYIPISNLGSEFYKHHAEPITKITRRLQLGSKFAKFLQSCSVFKVKQTGKIYEVAIFETLDKSAIAPHSVSDIKSASDLEQALLNILNNLISKSQTKHVPIGSLGVEFHKQYGVTILSIIKRLQLEGNFAKFVKSCSAFKVETLGTEYRVAIA